MHPLRPLLLVAASCGVLSAQATYTPCFPAVAPSPRSGVHGTSDGAGMLVFGGLLAAGSPPVFSDELWRFDGAAWTNFTPANSPSPRDWYASALDMVRWRYVLFGGRTAAGTGTIDLDDTWEFDGVTWTQRLPATAPAPRRWSAMVFDPTLARCVLFGGSVNGTLFFGDTWTWDGTTWQQLSPATSPGPRARGWLEYDTIRQRALYFGGKNTSGNTALADTWSWNGTTWTQLPTATPPGWNGGTGLIAYGMAFDPLRDRMVLVGGTRTTATVSDLTYEFDGTDWLLHSAGPVPGRTAPAVAFVAGLGQTCVFGGATVTQQQNDTWRYQTAAFPFYTPFGTGCAGASGVPIMTQLSPAWLGETHTTLVTNLAPLALPFALYGLSDTAWAGGQLPFPVQLAYPHTALGCYLRVSPDASTFLPNVGGTATVSLPLPAAVGLLGVDLFQQVVQLDFSLYLSVSAAARITLGAK